MEARRTSYDAQTDGSRTKLPSRLEGRRSSRADPLQYVKSCLGSNLAEQAEKTLSELNKSGTTVRRDSDIQQAAMIAQDDNDSDWRSTLSDWRKTRRQSQQSRASIDLSAFDECDSIALAESKEVLRGYYPAWEESGSPHYYQQARTSRSSSGGDVFEGDDKSHTTNGLNKSNEDSSESKNTDSKPKERPLERLKRLSLEKSDLNSNVIKEEQVAETSDLRGRRRSQEAATSQDSLSRNSPPKRAMMTDMLWKTTPISPEPSETANIRKKSNESTNDTTNRSGNDANELNELRMKEAKILQKQEELAEEQRKLKLELEGLRQQISNLCDSSRAQPSTAHSTTREEQGLPNDNRNVTGVEDNNWYVKASKARSERRLSEKRNQIIVSPVEQQKQLGLAAPTDSTPDTSSRTPPPHTDETKAKTPTTNGAKDQPQPAKPVGRVSGVISRFTEKFEANKAKADSTSDDFQPSESARKRFLNSRPSLASFPSAAVKNAQNSAFARRASNDQLMVGHAFLRADDWRIDTYGMKPKSASSEDDIEEEAEEGSADLGEN